MSTTGQVLLDPYRDLPLIKNQRFKLTSSDPFIPAYIKSTITNSSDPVGIYASRIQGRPILLENPARESKAKKERAEKKARHQLNQDWKGVGVIVKRRAKEKGVWRFDKTQAKLKLFLPLHQLWLAYMAELLSLTPPPSASSTPPTMPATAAMHAKLVKADFHGSMITVRQSKNPCLVGLSGIVVHETENTFKVVTWDDRIKLLPKQGSIFVFAVPVFSTPSSIPSQNSGPSEACSLEQETTVLDGPHNEFELHGNQFRFRSAERAGRKYKNKETIEL